jgi:hypothetical protein
MAKRKRARKVSKDERSKSPYFTQPGKRGAVVVLHRACGNRVVPKVCGTMPSRAHAKLLIAQLERAESVVKDLFLEATDDGIEALEAVLAACREEVLQRGPRVSDQSGGGGGATDAEGGGATDRGGRPRGRGRGRPRHRGESTERGPSDLPPAAAPTPVDSLDRTDERGEQSPYNEAAS